MRTRFSGILPTVVRRVAISEAVVMQSKSGRIDIVRKYYTRPQNA